MNQKKRHNPEITQEDLAARAFDKNNDALENLVQPEKGDLALQKEFSHLITKVFGQDLYFHSYHRETNIPFEAVEEYEKNAYNSWQFALQTRKKGFFSSAKFEEYFTIHLSETSTTDKEGKPVSQKIPLFTKGKFNPITIHAYTLESLKKAQEFAKSYKSFTGQEVTIVKECFDEEELKPHIPQKQNLEQKTESTKYNTPLIMSRLNEIDLYYMKMYLGIVSLHTFLSTVNAGLAINHFSKGKYGMGYLHLFASAVCGAAAYFSGKTALSKYEKALKDREEKK